MAEERRHILVVEDNPGDARLVREALRDAEAAQGDEPGFRTTEVARLADALASLAGGDVDLVLLDLALPDSDGLATFSQVRDAAPDVPVVVFTRLDDTSVAMRAVREGAQDYLTKAQLDAESLLRSVRYATERKQAERDRAALVREQAARAEAEAQRAQLDALTAELVVRERKLRAIFDGTRDAMLLADDQKRYVDANQAAVQLFGRPRAEILTLTIDDLTGTAPLSDEGVASWEAFRRDGTQSGEFEFARPDGERRTVEFSATASILPGVHLSAIRDVTARAAREAERADLLAREQWARASAELAQQRLELLAEASAALATTLDAGAVFERLARLVVPRLADWCSAYLQADDGAIAQAAVTHIEPAHEALVRELFARFPLPVDAPGGYARVLRTGESELTPEASAEHRAAAPPERRALLERLAPRSEMIVPLLVHGRVIGALAFGVRDQRPPYTAQDLGFAEELARRAAVAAENARLFAEAQRDRERAEAANRLKDEFVATISHELRTPLQSILGWAQLLRSEGALDPGRVAKGIQVIERNARAQSRIIEDILDVSRIVTGKLRIVPQTVPVRSFVEAAADTLRSTAEAKRITLSVDIAPDAGTLVGDADRLQQVVWNLLANGVKFTPAGGHVRVRAWRQASAVSIVVTDTGKGLSAAFLPHVFERFRQADGSSTRAQTGLGLGLAIVRHLVELHGGRVSASSDGEGTGATFTVELPATLSLATAVDRITPTTVRERVKRAVLPITGKRVMVVDDEADARELLATVLSEAGAVVCAVASAEQALAALAAFRPDALVSDIAMPEQDGYMLLRRIRALGSDDPRSRLPAVAVTAYARAEDRAAALDAGFQDHVTKPVDPATLVEAVARLLSPPPPAAP